MSLTFIDGFRDKTGKIELFSFDESLRQVKLDADDFVVCFDARKAVELVSNEIVFDLKMLLDIDCSLSSFVEKSALACKDEFLKHEQKFSAHANALLNANVDLESICLEELLPNGMLSKRASLRAEAMREILRSVTEHDIKHYKNRIWPLFKVISRMEDAKIKVDVEKISVGLNDSSLNMHETNFLRSIKSQEKNGFVKSAMSPVGSKTWRIRVESGFKCMSIPHGFCRSVLTSRFENGKICTLDFNAIDYRCLVEAVNDSDLTRFYAGVLDFHARTASLFGEVTPKLRDDIKKITYAHIYGGALDTLNASTGLSHFELKEMLIKLDKLFEPIIRFRNELVAESKKNGFLDTPGYHRIKIDDDFSPGKVIGLYAQTFSSFVFGKALSRADEIVRDIKSKMIFTVYDEVVFDLHPEEIRHASDIKKEIEKTTGFVTKMKIGENYEDVE